MSSKLQIGRATVLHWHNHGIHGVAKQGGLKWPKFCDLAPFIFPRNVVGVTWGVDINNFYFSLLFISQVFTFFLHLY